MSAIGSDYGRTMTIPFGRVRPVAAGHPLQTRSFVHARSADSTARIAVVAIAVRSSSEIVV
jgi:hypothetical protein